MAPAIESVYVDVELRRVAALTGAGRPGQNGSVGGDGGELNSAPGLRRPSLAFAAEAERAFSLRCPSPALLSALLSEATMPGL